MSAREPKLWRKVRDGKAYGCWWVTVNRYDVNLNTKSAEIARGRLPEAMAGKKKGWPNDAELAARATESGPAVAGTPAPGPRAPESSAGAPAPAAAAPAVTPDHVIPPGNGSTAPTAPPALPPMSKEAPPTPSSEESARAEAEATNAAAAETAGKSANDNDAGDAGAGPAFALGADAIRGMLAQGAAAIVELQLGLQAWLVFKRTGKIAPPVDPNSPIRKWAADAWVAQFEAWFPNMDTVPPWIIAVGLPAMALPIQFMAAQTPPPDQQQNRPGATAAPTPAPTEAPGEQAAA